MDIRRFAFLMLSAMCTGAFAGSATAATPIFFTLDIPLNDALRVRKVLLGHDAVPQPNSTTWSDLIAAIWSDQACHQRFAG
jgi:hypothetical protein